MSLENPQCPVCREILKSSQFNGGGYDNDCPRCGKYRIGKIAAEIELQNSSINRNQRLGLSFWLSKNQGAQLVSSNLKGLLNLRPPSIEERSEKLLLSLSKTFPIPGTKIRVNRSSERNDPNRPVVSFVGDGKIESINSNTLEYISFAQDQDELVFLLEDYLTNEKCYVATSSEEIKITPKGWSYIEKLKHGNIESNVGFIAMSFATEWDDLLSELIEPAILEAGYEPRRVDKQDHNNDITDEIIALIRQSRFVVADFSAENQGAYYEAGFARGLGRSVFHLCRQDRFNKLHLDTRQINHIEWNPTDYHRGKLDLRNRIIATIGKGSG